MEAKTMNKKLSAFLLMAIFLVSLVPAAFAQNSNAGEETDNLVADVPAGIPLERCLEQVMDNHPDATDERARRACRIHAANRLSDVRQQRVDVTKKRTDVRVQRVGEARDRADHARDRVQDARKRYVKAKRNFHEARADYREKRDRFRQARSEVRKCRGDDSEKCDAHRKDMRREAPKFLLKAADTVLHTLERVKAKIDESDVDDEKKAELLADLDERIAAIEDAATTIEGMDEDTPKEDVQEAANTIREEWTKSRHLLRRAVNHVVNAKLGNIVHRADKLAEKLGKIRDRLEAKGHDVSAIDSALADFEAKLDEAKSFHRQALEAFQSGDESSVQTAQDLHKQARDALKEARDALREVVKSIREAAGSVDDAESDDANEESDESEEEEESDETEEESEDESDETEDEAEEESEESEDESDDESDETEEESEDESEEESEDESNE